MDSSKTDQEHPYQYQDKSRSNDTPAIFPNGVPDNLLLGELNQVPQTYQLPLRQYQELSNHISLYSQELGPETPAPITRADPTSSR
jgi:hypothetical protein